MRMVERFKRDVSNELTSDGFRESFGAKKAQYQDKIAQMEVADLVQDYLTGIEMVR